MELVIFARFHAREGQAAVMREVSGPTQAGPDCLSQCAYRSVRDARLFFIHSRLRDEQAFERHAQLPTPSVSWRRCKL
jgi:quinol monooxygenase YgiN